MPSESWISIGVWYAQVLVYIFLLLNMMYTPSFVNEVTDDGVQAEHNENGHKNVINGPNMADF